MDNLPKLPQELATELEARLRQRRRALTDQLHRRRGAFWHDVEATRSRWQLPPMAGVPFPDPWLWSGASVHLPLSCLRSVLRWYETEAVLRRDWDSGIDEWRAAVVESLEVLGDWLHEVRGLYERTMPLAERQNDLTLTGTFDDFVRIPASGPPRVGGDLFTDHWAPFLSGCLLFDPPPDDLERFADHVVLDPRSVELAWQDQSDSTPPRIMPPGVAFVPDPKEIEAVEHWKDTGDLVRLHARLEPRGINLLGELRAMMDEDLAASVDDLRRSLMAEYLDRKNRIPLQRYVDPSGAGNQKIGTQAHALLAKGRAGRPRIDPLEATQVAALQRQGLTEPAIAERLGYRRHPEAYDSNPRRSNPVRGRIKRDRELTGSGADD